MPSSSVKHDKCPIQDKEEYVIYYWEDRRKWADTLWYPAASLKTIITNTGTSLYTLMTSLCEKQMELKKYKWCNLQIRLEQLQIRSQTYFT